METARLDVISIGRSSVDLYGQQVGGRLEDMGSFSKAVGGCPTNIAIGTARLGLRSGVITRVGDEHMGRFIREQLAREGVAIEGVHTDPARLTALVLLGVRDEHSFPLIFYRDNCADAALDESDIDPAFVARAGAVLVTGTHFARPAAAAAAHRAMAMAKQNGARVGFGGAYRPNLWGHGRRDPRDPGGVGGHHRLQARPDGVRRIPGRHPRQSGRRHPWPRLPCRGVQRAGSGGRLHVRLPARLAARGAA